MQVTVQKKEKKIKQLSNMHATQVAKEANFRNFSRINQSKYIIQH